MFQWWKRMRSRPLLIQAYQAAEAGNYVEAAKLLERAATIEQLDPSIWNEMAFCYGKMGNLERAEHAARQAISIDPMNPKFRNSLVGVFLDAGWQQTSCQELRAILDKAGPELEAMLQLAVYPPALLAQALFLAFSGEPEKVWNGALEEAGRLYAQVGDAPARFQPILKSKRLECLNAAELNRQLCGLP